MKRKLTWVLVADGGRARIFECLGIGKGLRQLPQFDEALTLPANHELQDDRPGRSFESAGPMRHSYEVGDPHRALKTKFACHLVHELSTLHDAGAFNHLVLVAPPEMLGNLRSALGSGLSTVVVGELERDLTHLPMIKVAEHLEGVAPV